MQYWTKNGSIPSTETDGTEGWQQAPSPPTDIPDGKELVWLNWEWIVRDPKPADRSGWQWNWNHTDRAWVESAWGNVDVIEPIVEIQTLATTQITNLTTAQVI